MVPVLDRNATRVTAIRQMSVWITGQSIFVPKQQDVVKIGSVQSLVPLMLTHVVNLEFANAALDLEDLPFLRINADVRLPTELSMIRMDSHSASTLGVARLEDKIFCGYVLITLITTTLWIVWEGSANVRVVLMEMPH